jgi:light-regulated signal transduction histidine kinase (bacteriophytochrome)
MTARDVKSEEIDLLHCAREPIHVPGRIQSHGVLLALEEPALVIRQVSANAEAFFGRPAEQLLGASLTEFLRPEQRATLSAHLEQANLADVNPLRLTLLNPRGEASFDAILHRSGGLLVVELEPPSAETSSFQGFYHLVRAAVSRLQNATTIDELCNVAAEEVRRITGLDRVMVYAFDAAWNGTVVAEDKQEDMEPWLGLHYPASDIPGQARRLYTINWLRLIADVNDTPSPLLPAENPLTGKPLDLTQSVLRSVSPVHLEYLRNMEVGASMSISLMRQNRLWGLIACHQRTARHIPYVVRLACEFLGQVLSLQLSLKEDHADYERQVALQERLAGVLGHLASASDFVGGLGVASPSVLDVVDAGGAVLYLDSQIHTYGETPPDQEVRDLLSWLETEHGRDTFYTDSLARLYPRAETFSASGSGLLTVALTSGNRLVWFRPEVVRTVNWAGNPEKAAVLEEEGLRLHPRRSFELWKQTVRLKSTRWRQPEVLVAEQLRNALQDILYRQAEADAKAQLEDVNRKLAQSNSELDWFAYIASHDLKEPLRGIQNFAKFLTEDYGEQLDEDGRTKLATVVRLGGMMEALLDGLLTYSRLGRVDLAVQSTDLNRVVEEASDLLLPAIQRQGVSIRVPRPLPTLRCDRIRIGEVFTNLISNGFKYSDKAERWVEIGYREAEDGQPLTLYVRDNGIGIQPRYFDSIFDMFRRLHTRDKFGGGTGVGLAIVRKIVERHSGRIWVESTPGEGTTFFFTLEPRAEDEVGVRAPV